MDAIEIRRELVRKHAILTYDEWYAMNRDAFELVRNECFPWDLYQEYVDEEVEARIQMLSKITTTREH